MDDRRVKWASVEVSGELIGMFATKGWRGDGIECTEGLPPSAILVKMIWGHGKKAVRLIFEDESFESVPISSIPTLSVNYKRTVVESINAPAKT